MYCCLIKVQQLTRENLKLKEKVADLERLVDPTVLQNYKPASWEASTGVATKFDYSLSLVSFLQFFFYIIIFYSFFFFFIFFLSHFVFFN